MALLGLRGRARARAPTIGHIADRGSIVIRQHWNSLGVGDHVLVHDETQPEQPIVPGRVVAVRPAPGTNHIAIRITPSRGSSTIVHPRRLSVHLDELDPDRHCWRCNSITAADAAP